MSNIQEKVELLTFESLPQVLQLTPELLEQMVSLLQNKNWIDSFNCITALRSINKYYP